MSKKLLFSVLVLFSLVLMTACEPEFIPASQAEVEMDFVPLDSLTTWEYRMDSIIFDNEGLTVDTFVSYRQERLAGVFTDSEGKEAHRLIISKKVDWNDEYKETDLWTTQINDAGFQRKEENLNFVKLIFPVVLGETWDGNQFLDTTKVFVAGEELRMYTNWKYEYDSRHDSMTVRGEVFNDVLRVFQANNTNALHRRYSVEHYAKGVGLIRRDMEILDTQCIDPACETIPWQDKAEKGFILKQELINYF